MSNTLNSKILNSLPDGKVVQVSIGLHWTAVVLDVAGELRCGLASAFTSSLSHGEVDVPLAGKLQAFSALELAALIDAPQLATASIGAAAINALLPRQPDTWQEINAEEVIANHGKGKSVALVGHFPFIPRLAQRVGDLKVLELNPRPGDLPAEKTEEVIPAAQVVAITGSTLLNHTLDGLLQLCSPQALVILLGPTTFLSPIMFEHGIDLLCGAVVTEIEPVVKAVQQGGNFRQVHHAGVRLVSIRKP